ncbi:HxlR family transcriptional regulator [Kitasatospora indigofera]|uniref:HxlR family transcriptional regulator n=1 Tax=Kitasatospora indigofera TaxID=67307 RepID=A0A919FPN1_9ACTN|nr:helix-turn-helix domain-containing protein [Kitasatospora indigofera]GHH69633.1 HxlR family transcriptional regulator [Kitasatospora indigofera]
MDDSPGSVFLADCPARLAIEIITNKWAVVVLFALSRGPCRHGELVDLVGGISRKVLTQTLRRLQGYGLVERRAYPEAPPRVEYTLTELGLTLVEPIAVLTDWARSYGGAVVSFQEAAEEASEPGSASKPESRSGG